MAFTHQLFIFCVILLPNIQSLTFEDVNFLDREEYYKNSVRDLFTKRLNGTNFCESVLLPSEQSYRKSLHATLSLSKINENAYMNHNCHVDSCCQSLHKCEAKKRNDPNDANIRHCQCIHFFRTCLKNVNSTVADEVAFIYSVNATKCYAKAYPILECLEFERYSKGETQFDGSIALAEREKFFNRCIRYKFDGSQPQTLQLFDLPVGHYNMSTGDSESDDGNNTNLNRFDEDDTDQIICKRMPSRDTERIILNEMTDTMASAYEQLEGVKVLTNDLLQWTGLIVPKNAPYNKGAFRININFNVVHPLEPPKIYFTTKIYHPNIDEDGNVSLPMISPANWKRTTIMGHVIDALIALVNDPEPEHPLRADLAEEFLKDREKFFETAEEFTRKYSEKRPQNVVLSLKIVYD